MQTFDLPFEYNGASGNVFVQQLTNHRDKEFHIFLTDELRKHTGLSYLPVVYRNNVFHLSADYIPSGAEPVCTAILKALELSPMFRVQPRATERTILGAFA